MPFTKQNTSIITRNINRRIQEYESKTSNVSSSADTRSLDSSVDFTDLSNWRQQLEDCQMQVALKEQVLASSTPAPLISSRFRTMDLDTFKEKYQAQRTWLEKRLNAINIMQDYLNQLPNHPNKWKWQELLEFAERDFDDNKAMLKTFYNNYIQYRTRSRDQGSLVVRTNSDLPSANDFEDVIMSENDPDDPLAQMLERTEPLSLTGRIGDLSLN